MITDRQLEYIRDLYIELSYEPEEDIESLSKEEASKLIDELVEMKGEINRG